MDLLYFQYIDFFKSIGLAEFGILSWYVLPFCIIAAALIFVVVVLVLAERKILALFTVRKGPNRVGFWGLLQTIADAIKILFKEDIVPKGADKILHFCAPIVVFVPVMILWFLIPYSGQFNIINTNVDVFLFIALLSFTVLGIILAGYASNNKFSLLGGIRSAAQLISYEIPLLIVAIGICVLSGSLNFNDIVLAQTSQCGLMGWFIFPAVIGFVVFFIASLAELNRTPFDLPEAESELVGGYNTEYSGMKFALFFLGEYALMFVVSAFVATMFLGGYLSPFGCYIAELFHWDYLFTNVCVMFEQIFWLVFKTCLILFVVIWIRATLPRLRADKLMSFSWKVLLPLSILNFFIVCMYKYFCS